MSTTNFNPQIDFRGFLLLILGLGLIILALTLLFPWATTVLWW
jgi:hypothetical protein